RTPAGLSVDAGELLRAGELSALRDRTVAVPRNAFFLGFDALYINADGDERNDAAARLRPFDRRADHVRRDRAELREELRLARAERRGAGGELFLLLIEDRRREQTTRSERALHAGGDVDDVALVVRERRSLRDVDAGDVALEIGVRAVV